MSRNFADGLSRALAGRARLTAAVDVDLNRARADSEQLPGCRAYQNYQDALPEMDAALVVLPHQLHHEVGMACLAAGKHVMIEKPLANSELPPKWRARGSGGRWCSSAATHGARP